jgi:LacI family transcriptional regulator
MTNYLIELGHRRIALHQGPPEQIASAERERGFRARQRQDSAGRAYPSSRDISLPLGPEAARRLLAPAPADRHFRQQRRHGRRAVSVAHRRGLDVPATSAWSASTTPHRRPPFGPS